MTTNQIEKLVEFVRYYAKCPCCEKNDVCADGCTFAHDDPVGDDVMTQAREAFHD